MYIIEYMRYIMSFFHQVNSELVLKNKKIGIIYLGAYYSINVDQRVMNLTKNNMTNSPSRYTYDEAQVYLDFWVFFFYKNSFS
jgi:hypothetical protein